MNNVYVYAYLDTRNKGNYLKEYGIDEVPFYVGIGTNSRLYDHIIYAKGKRFKTSYRINKIRKMLREGHEPKIIKLKENLTVDQAKELEIKLIAEIGTIKNVIGVKRGPLTNLTRGGDGMIGYDFSKRKNYNHDNNSGKIGIHLNDIRVMVHRDELDSYLSSGWSLGFGECVKTSGTLNTKWMNNGVTSKVVHLDDVKEYLSNGWSFGFSNDRKTVKGKIIITKDGFNKTIDPKDLSLYLEEGWTQGQRKSKVTCYVCGMQGIAPNINRWHNDNCKKKK